MVDTSSPPPPQTAPQPPKQRHNHTEHVAESPRQLLHNLNVIKEFIQHDKDDDYISLMSTLTLKKKRRMLFMPLEFEKVKIDALVGS